LKTPARIRICRKPVLQDSHSSLSAWATLKARRTAKSGCPTKILHRYDLSVKWKQS
jgi:hypothetical protein